MVLKDNVLYVANLQDANTTKAGIAPDGEIDRYNATTGQFLGAYSRPAGWVGQFNPRAVVFGPDGNLYASVFDSSNLVVGSVVQIQVNTGAESLFASNSGGAPDLHRPEGLTFGPDGNLYITGFRANAGDTDKVVILNASGAEVDSIALDAVGQPRSYGQALLFGPGGHLFVPITTPGSPDLGAVRSYDVSAKTFTNFEAPGTLGQPWYLTFGNTDPATLAYNAGPAAANDVAALGLAALTASGTSTAGTGSPAAVTVSTSSSSSVSPAIPVAAPAADAATGSASTSGAAWGDDLFGDPLAAHAG
jgi:hypothetical protein